MHGMQLRKTNSFSDQPAAPSTKRKMGALYALCIPLSCDNLTRFAHVFFVGIIAVCIDCFNMEWHEKCSQLLQIPVFSCPKTVGQRFSCLMVNSPPQPVLLGFVVDKRPHFVHFRTIYIDLLRRYHRYLYFLIRMLLDILFVYLPQSWFRFFKIAVTVSFEIPRIRPVARVPVQSVAMTKTCRRTFGSYALYVYSSTKL